MAMSGKTVNVPTNEKIKEQDVNFKLQLYGIYRGKLGSIRYTLRNISDFTRL